MTRNSREFSAGDSGLSLTNTIEHNWSAFIVSISSLCINNIQNQNQQNNKLMMMMMSCFIFTTPRLILRGEESEEKASVTLVIGSLAAGPTRSHHFKALAELVEIPHRFIIIICFHVIVRSVKI